MVERQPGRFQRVVRTRPRWSGLGSECVAVLACGHERWVPWDWDGFADLDCSTCPPTEWRFTPQLTPELVALIEDVEREAAS